jgi:hypothetical protein
MSACGVWPKMCVGMCGDVWGGGRGGRGGGGGEEGLEPGGAGLVDCSFEASLSKDYLEICAQLLHGTWGTGT